MRLALLHYTAPPVPGGVERILAGHARLLAAEGHEVTLLAGEGAPLPGAMLTVLPELRRAADSPTRDFEPEAARLRELLRPHLRTQAAVFLHNVCTMPFHPALTMALWDLAAELSPTTRFICWVHDLAAAQPEYTFPSEPDRPWGLLRRACPHFEYVAVSEHRRTHLETTLGIAPERCRVIPNGLWPFDHFGLSPELQAFAARTRLLERDLLLLHPARLVRRKNLQASLHTLAALHAQGHDAALLITGPTDPHQPASMAYATELLTLRAQLGLADHAHFLALESGPLEGTDLDALYRLADAILLPSLHEGFGLPVLEAALHRVPLFAPRLPPLLASLGEHPELYPPFFSPSEVAAHLIRQLAGSHPIQARRRALRQYAWPAVYQKYIGPLLAETSHNSLLPTTP